ncbi:MAG: hypothetical protein LBB56_01185 [Chitinispirillales bacterium]|jgi:hypothetical protein|nr:hypothetical protein [Chitinispirillales bacterium]
MKRFSTLAAALLFTVCAVSSSYAIAGLGFHWGLDFSMDMKNNPKDVVYSVGDMGDMFDDMFDGDRNPTFSLLGINDDDAFLYVSRENWKRSAINFGGKAYIDIIPVIETIELSCSFGLWQYDGMINYLTVDGTNLIYESVPLGLDDVNLKYFSLSGTPYAKFQFDASVRKKVFALPANIFRINAGAGASAHFATPLLSSKLIGDVLSSKSKFKPEDLAAGSFDKELSKAIVEKIIDGLAEPAFGVHLLIGTQFKLPIIPAGIYADGKVMIPITKFEDSDAGKDLKGIGFLLNVGASLSF